MHKGQYATFIQFGKHICLFVLCTIWKQSQPVQWRSVFLFSSSLGQSLTSAQFKITLTHYAFFTNATEFQGMLSTISWLNWPFKGSGTSTHNYASKSYSYHPWDFACHSPTLRFPFHTWFNIMGCFPHQFSSFFAEVQLSPTLSQNFQAGNSLS